jgi:sugar phosphate isomerase/epimerase
MVVEFATSTLFCLHKPFEDALADLILDETRCIEFVDEGLHALTRRRVDRLLEMKASYDLRYAVHAPFTDVNIAAHDDSLREGILNRIERSIRSASALEAEALTFHPGATTALEHFYPGKAWELNLTSVRRLLRYAVDYGIPALIENVPDPFPFLMKSVEDFKRFFDEVEFEVNMVLDIAHSNIRGQTLEFIRSFSDHIRHIHVSDNLGQKDEHLQVGEGSIDWKETMAAIRMSHFRGWMVVESYRGISKSIRLLGNLTTAT